jgi:hypothetical protein
MPLSIPIDPNSVAVAAGGGYIVASKSVDGAFRLVWGTECSCPAAGPTCRHRKLVAAYVKAQDAARRRPSAPVNVSLMVD